MIAELFFFTRNFFAECEFGSGCYVDRESDVLLQVLDGHAAYKYWLKFDNVRPRQIIAKELRNLHFKFPNCLNCLLCS